MGQKCAPWLACAGPTVSAAAVPEGQSRSVCACESHSWLPPPSGDDLRPASLGLSFLTWKKDNKDQFEAETSS